MTATPCALVTGASAGIGAAFARELAARGHALAGELRAKHHVDVHCIACDLADPAAPQFLEQEIARRGLIVGTLVNNAGYGVTGTFLSKPWQIHADFIQVLMTAPAELCHRLLPGMRARGHGRIINVASLAGLMPAPAGHTLYAASKAYLIKFSQALALENRAHGVNVCAICPGFTWSEFHDVTGTREQMKSLPRFMWMRAEPVVRDALDAVERGRIVRVSGRVNRSIKRLFELLPDRLALYLIDRRGKDFRNAHEAQAPPPG
jgi:short-subunit dehydrogenase